MSNIYPKTPGFKRGGTSQRAAAEIIEYARNLQEKCFGHLMLRPQTTDELSISMDVSPFSVRPRVSELVSSGRAVDSGETRESSWSGKQMIVWRVATPEEIADMDGRIETLLEMLAEQD